jgi:hypothetical protein
MNAPTPAATPIIVRCETFRLPADQDCARSLNKAARRAFSAKLPAIQCDAVSRYGLIRLSARCGVTGFARKLAARQAEQGLGGRARQRQSSAFGRSLIRSLIRRDS